MEIKEIEKYGKMVKQNVAMDTLRKTECLCLNCEKLVTGECETAKKLYDICKDHNVAMAITRCPNFVKKEEK